MQVEGKARCPQPTPGRDINCGGSDRAGRTAGDSSGRAPLDVRVAEREYHGSEEEDPLDEGRSGDEGGEREDPNQDPPQGAIDIVGMVAGKQLAS